MLLTVDVAGLACAAAGATQGGPSQGDWRLAGIVCGSGILIQRALATYRPITVGPWRREFAAAYRPVRIVTLCLAVAQAAQALASTGLHAWPADVIAAAFAALAIDFYLVSCIARERPGASGAP